MNKMKITAKNFWKFILKSAYDDLKVMKTLARSGISFTEDQKNKIKELCQRGKALDAQKLILKRIKNGVHQ